MTHLPFVETGKKEHLVKTIRHLSLQSKHTWGEVVCFVESVNYILSGSYERRIGYLEQNNSGPGASWDMQSIIDFVSRKSASLTK